MADSEKKDSGARISQEQRLHYIGFEVFPGKPKDLFKSEDEKNIYLQSVREKHDKGDLLRENCTLCEERVSGLERIVMTVASLAILVSLFLPWYSAYKETVESAPVVSSDLTAPSTTSPADTLLTAPDTTLTASSTDTGTVEAAPPPPQSEEEIITATQTKRKVTRDYFQLSGIGSLADIGNSGAIAMGSGIGLLLTAVILILYTLACLAIPVYILISLFSLKGDPDTVALKLKKRLKIAWWPLLALTLAFLLSFIGGTYSVNVSDQLTSLGSSYGPFVFLSTLSWGVFLSVVGFLLLGLKGIEI